MKLTTENEFKGLLKEFFKRRILESVAVESVDRAVRGEEDDYPEENEGPGTTYEAVESVDRAVRGEEDDYSEEDEGLATTYEHLKFETNLYSDADKEGGDKSVDETNLYSDADEEGSEQVDETNLYSDSDKEGTDETDKKGKSHAAERGSKGNYPGPPAGLTAGKIPRLSDVFAENAMLFGVVEFLSKIQKSKKK